MPGLPGKSVLARLLGILASVLSLALIPALALASAALILTLALISALALASAALILALALIPALALASAALTLALALIPALTLASAALILALALIPALALVSAALILALLAAALHNCIVCSLCLHGFRCSILSLSCRFLSVPGLAALTLGTALGGTVLLSLALFSSSVFFSPIAGVLSTKYTDNILFLLCPVAGNLTFSQTFSHIVCLGFVHTAGMTLDVSAFSSQKLYHFFIFSAQFSGKFVYSHFWHTHSSFFCCWLTSFSIASAKPASSTAILARNSLPTALPSSSLVSINKMGTW